MRPWAVKALLATAASRATARARRRRLSQSSEGSWRWWRIVPGRQPRPSPASWPLVLLLPLGRPTTAMGRLPAAVAPPQRPWRPGHPSAGPHCLRPSTVLRRRPSSAGRWSLESGRSCCYPEPAVPPGFKPLGPRHGCVYTHVALGWYTPLPPPSLRFLHYCW